MKKILLFLGSVIATLGANSQVTSFEWSNQIGNSSDDFGKAITTDASGNVYTTGFFSGTVDFDPSAGTTNLIATGTIDVFISKFDASGNFVWAKNFGGTGSNEGLSIAIDGSGDVYTTGYFQGTADFDPGAGTNNITSSGTGDLYILKLNSSGNFVWAISVGGTNFDEGNSITFDGSGNIYTTGYFQGTVDFDPGVGTNNLVSAGAADIFVLKLSSVGNFIWAKNMGGTGSSYGFGQSISLDGTGNSYVTGSFQGAIDFDPGAGTNNLASAGNEDIFVLKLDGSGNFVWAKRIGSSTGDGGSSLALDASGNVYTTGYFQGTVDFDPGAGTNNLTSGSSGDAFISKLDGAGNFLWAKQMGGAAFTYGDGIVLDTYGNVYTTGYLSYGGAIDFDPGAGTSNLTAVGNQDMFTVKLDNAGNFVWVRQISAGASTNTTSEGITLDGDNNIYTTGLFNGTTDFNEEAGTYNLTSSGGYDIFIHKMSQCPIVTTNITSQTNVTCYGSSDGAVTINATGGTSFTYAWSPSGGSSATATGLAAGTYNCLVTNQCGATATQNVTIGQPLPSGATSGPGGVGTNADTELWFDASSLGLANNSTVGTWTDRSGNSRSATQGTLANRPIFLTNQLNSLPAINFDGSNDYLSTGAVSDLDTDNQTWLFVTKANNNMHTGHIMCNAYTTGTSSGVDQFWKSYMSSTSGKYTNLIKNSTGTSLGTASNYDSNYHIIENVWNGATDIITTYDNGSSAGSQSGANATPGGHVRLRLGAQSTAVIPATYYNGKLAEAIVYSKTLNEAERIIVENYLAAKYNLTLSGTDIYAYDATHGFQAAGIGMQSSTSLSSARGGIVEMSNPTSLANGDFLMWGHDNATTVSSTSDVPTAYGATSGKRMQRVWRADKTNDAGDVTITFYLSGIAAGTLANLELLIDNDGVFTDATRITSGYSYDDGCDVVSWTNVSLSDGQYFTVGSPNGVALLRTANANALAENGAEEAEKDIVVFPNPNNGEFSLLVNELSEGMTAEVYNWAGQLVHKQTVAENQTVINIEQQAAGIYFVKVIAQDKILKVSKIVKQ